MSRVAYPLGKSRSDPAPMTVVLLDAWFGRVAGRPSAEQSLHPAAVTAGMRA